MIPTLPTEPCPHCNAADEIRWLRQVIKDREFEIAELALELVRAKQVTKTS